MYLAEVINVSCKTLVICLGQEAKCDTGACETEHELTVTSGQSDCRNKWLYGTFPYKTVTYS